MKLKFGQRLQCIEYRIGKILVCRVRECEGYGVQYNPTRQTSYYDVSLWVPFEEAYVKCKNLEDARAKLKKLLGKKGVELVKSKVAHSVNDIKMRELQ